MQKGKELQLQKILSDKSIPFSGSDAIACSRTWNKASIIEVDMFADPKPSTHLTESTKDNLSKKLDFEKERLKSF